MPGLVFWTSSKSLQELPKNLGWWIIIFIKGLLLRGTPRIPNHQPKSPSYHWLIMVVTSILHASRSGSRLPFRWEMLRCPFFWTQVIHKCRKNKRWLEHFVAWFWEVPSECAVGDSMKFHKFAWVLHELKWDPILTSTVRRMTCNFSSCQNPGKPSGKIIITILRRDIY